jgi:dethiobiotin synthetase
MSSRFVISATDTDVGKTVFAAALAGALGAHYWKPIQCGLEEGGDIARVKALSGLPDDHLLPEAYRLKLAASPHRAAEAEGVEIDVARLVPPSVDTPLVIEGAGGIMVPVTRRLLLIDLLATWGIPVILCARTALGTINHSLLSLAALRARSIPVHGIAFIGDENSDTERTIAEMGEVRSLGRLPFVDPLDSRSLAGAFAANFRREDFLS